MSVVRCWVMWVAVVTAMVASSWAAILKHHSEALLRHIIPRSEFPQSFQPIINNSLTFLEGGENVTSGTSSTNGMIVATVSDRKNPNKSVVMSSDNSVAIGGRLEPSLANDDISHLSSSGDYFPNIPQNINGFSSPVFQKDVPVLDLEPSSQMFQGGGLDLTLPSRLGDPSSQMFQEDELDLTDSGALFYKPYIVTSGGFLSVTAMNFFASLESENGKTELKVTNEVDRNSKTLTVPKGSTVAVTNEGIFVTKDNQTQNYSLPGISNTDPSSGIANISPPRLGLDGSSSQMFQRGGLDLTLPSRLGDPSPQMFQEDELDLTNSEALFYKPNIETGGGSLSVTATNYITSLESENGKTELKITNQINRNSTTLTIPEGSTVAVTNEGIFVTKDNQTQKYPLPGVPKPETSNWGDRSLLLAPVPKPELSHPLLVDSQPPKNSELPTPSINPPTPSPSTMPKPSAPSINSPTPSPSTTSKPSTPSINSPTPSPSTTSKPSTPSINSPMPSPSTTSKPSTPSINSPTPSLSTMSKPSIPSINNSMAHRGVKILGKSSTFQADTGIKVHTLTSLSKMDIPDISPIITLKLPNISIPKIPSISKHFLNLFGSLG